MICGSYNESYKNVYSGKVCFAVTQKSFFDKTLINFPGFDAVANNAFRNSVRQEHSCPNLRQLLVVATNHLTRVLQNDDQI